MENWWRHGLVKEKRVVGRSNQYSTHFYHCILIYQQLALRVFASQHMKAQVEALYSLSIIYYIFGLIRESLIVRFYKAMQTWGGGGLVKDVYSRLSIDGNQRDSSLRLLEVWNGYWRIFLIKRAKHFAITVEMLYKNLLVMQKRCCKRGFKFDYISPKNNFVISSVFKKK
jgi:hypothetical protein